MTKAWNSTLNVGAKSLKATKGLNRVSKKMAIQKRLEIALKFELLKECDYQCQFCGNSVFTHRLDKHEIIPRGEGGNATDKSNCLILCCFCHARCDLDSTKPEKITREMLYKIKNKRSF